jgi:hypothetical protein
MAEAIIVKAQDLELVFILKLPIQPISGNTVAAAPPGSPIAMLPDLTALMTSSSLVSSVPA